MLAEAGADLWVTNCRGDLPLHEAIQSGNRELVRWTLLLILLFLFLLLTCTFLSI
jgi:hypothetical protein